MNESIYFAPQVSGMRIMSGMLKSPIELANWQLPDVDRASSWVYINNSGIILIKANRKLYKPDLVIINDLCGRRPIVFIHMADKRKSKVIGNRLFIW